MERLHRAGGSSLCLGEQDWSGDDELCGSDTQCDPLTSNAPPLESTRTFARAVTPPPSAPFPQPEEREVLDSLTSDVTAEYLMCVGTPTERSGVGSMGGTFDTYILESDAITGPFRIVSYLQAFGPQAYFVNLPTFAMGDAPADARGSGYLDARLSYSSNFGLRDKALAPQPKGSGYAWDLLPVRLLLASGGASIDAVPD